MPQVRGANVAFEVRAADGVTVLRDGKRTSDGEIMVNRRGNNERLFEFVNEAWKEVGAYAGPGAVEHECRCGNPSVECVCAVPTEGAEIREKMRAPLPTWGGRVGSAPGETGQYSSLKPEPIEVMEAWGMNFHEAQVLKYISRYPRKGGVEDLKKAQWFLNRLIAREMAKENNL